MEITFKVAAVDDSDLIGSLVVDLTTEICELTNATHFDIEPNEPSYGHPQTLINVYTLLIRT